MNIRSTIYEYKDDKKKNDLEGVSCRSEQTKDRLEIDRNECQRCIRQSYIFHLLSIHACCLYKPGDFLWPNQIYSDKAVAKFNSLSLSLGSLSIF